MTINYYGKTRTHKHGRMACICINWNKEQEELVQLEKMAKLLVIKGYSVDEGLYGMLLVKVDEPSDYDAVVKDYKELKKSIALWKKFGF